MQTKGLEAIDNISHSVQVNRKTLRALVQPSVSF